MRLDGRVRVAVMRHVERAVDQGRAGDEGDEQRQDRAPRIRLLLGLHEREGAQHEHGRDARADRGLGEGHVDGVEHDEHGGREQAVDAAQHDHREQAPQTDDHEYRRRHEGQQHDVDRRLYDPAPSSSFFSRSGRIPAEYIAFARALHAVGLVKKMKASMSSSLIVTMVKPP